MYNAHNVRSLDVVLTHYVIVFQAQISITDQKRVSLQTPAGSLLLWSLAVYCHGDGKTPLACSERYNFIENSKSTSPRYAPPSHSIQNRPRREHGACRPKLSIICPVLVSGFLGVTGDSEFEAYFTSLHSPVKILIFATAFRRLVIPIAPIMQSINQSISRFQPIFRTE